MLFFFSAPGGRIISWNVGAERIKGYKPEKIRHSVPLECAKQWLAADWKLPLNRDGIRVTIA